MVKPLNITNNDVYVQGNVKSGDIIAVAGVPYLRENQEVTLQSKISKYLTLTEIGF